MIETRNDYRSERILLAAAELGYIDIVSELANPSEKMFYGKEKIVISPNAQDGQALVNAAGNGHQSMVEYLIGKGVSPSAWDGQALVNAAGNGHQSMVEYLVGKGVSSDAQDGLVLVSVAKNGDQSMLEYLIGKGVSADAHYGLALFFAAGNGNQSMVEYLIGKGADIELAFRTVQICGNVRAFQTLQQMRRRR